MLRPDQFVAAKSASEGRWLLARKHGVTATQVAKASSGPGGFRQAAEDYWADWAEPDNPYMAFGREWEGPISLHLKASLGVMPNDWLIRHPNYPHHMATPDGISLDHEVISEVKTTGKDWDPDKIPIQYRRQVQWQLYVTGARECVFAWMLREERDGAFLPAWFDPKVIRIPRDEEMIAELVMVADRLWERVNDE